MKKVRKWFKKIKINLSLGEVPEHLENLKLELEKTFESLEKKNEMLINAMTKNFGKTH
jgi:superoxide dismutase